MLPGDGEYDFGHLFKKLKADNYDGPCLIEVYNSAYKEYDQLIEAYNFVNKIHKMYWQIGIVCYNLSKLWKIFTIYGG